MIVLHKLFTGLIVVSLLSIIPTAIKPIVQLVSSVNAGRYIALPESMAWQCVETVKRQHARQIELAQKIKVDPVIKWQMIKFEQAGYEKDLKRLCNMVDLSELPPRETLMEIKP